MTSGGNDFNHSAENQLTKFSARDAGDFSDAAGEREMAPKCGSLPRDAGDLVGLRKCENEQRIKCERQDYRIGTKPVLTSVMLI